MDNIQLEGAPDFDDLDLTEPQGDDSINDLPTAYQEADPGFESAEAAIEEYDKDEILERRHYLDQLRRRKELFPKVYDTVVVQRVDLLPNDQLHNLVAELDLAINLSNSNGMIIHAFNNAMKLLQSVGTNFGLKLNGFSNEIEDDEQIQNTLKELSLVYENIIYMPPHLRLAVLMLQKVGKTHAKNVYLEEMSAQKTAVNPNLAAKYKDL